MRITEFNKQPTAKALNESAAQMFGQKLNLDSFTLEQMLDARNKLRTKVSQFEGASNFNAVYEDETYGKNKMFLDVLNVAIEERESAAPQFTEMEELVLAKVAEGVLAFDEIPAELQEKAEIKARMYGAKIDESVITEGEEEKAELIMAARDMVDRITGWMEDTANMQAESMLELIDSIRDEMGSDLAMEFESMVKPSLATIYTALESSRQNLTQSVGLLTGEGQDQTPMMGEEPPMDDMGADDMSADDAMPGEGDGSAPETDEFAADAAAAGGEESAGRMTRESVEYSRKLASLLAPKKK
jgi:hypothetical protein